MFNSARLKLTFWYAIISLVISSVFSLIIYQRIDQDLVIYEQTRLQRLEKMRQYLTFSIPDEESAESNPLLLARKRLLLSLGVINLLIITVSAFSGYALASLTLKPIEDMLDSQRRFVSDASHELKTPLTSLRAAFEVYLRQSRHSQAESQLLVRESLQEVVRMQSLSESLLKLVKSEQLSSHQALELVSLSQAVLEAVKKTQVLFREKHQQVITHLRELDVRATPSGLVDLIVILLDNAGKYSPENSTVTLTIESAGKSILLKVADQGIGISKTDLPNIFDRFYRADSARGRSEHQSFGLGLSIAKQLAESFSARITVDSHPGKGSTFTIRFPKTVPSRLV